MRTSFISYARSLWLRRASTIALALVAVAAAEAAPAERGRGSDVEQAWFRLAQGLDKPSQVFLKERTDELLFTAAKADLKRLTPLALALVAQARTLTPAAATPMLVQATRLDPGSAETWFALAENRLRQLSLFSGFSALSRGVYTLVSDRRLGSFVQPSALLAVQGSLLVAFALWAAVAIRKRGICTRQPARIIRKT